jgi:hypothetical protein
MDGMLQSDHKDFALGKHMTVEFYDCDSEFLACFRQFGGKKADF